MAVVRPGGPVRWPPRRRKVAVATRSTLNDALQIFHLQAAVVLGSRPVLGSPKWLGPFSHAAAAAGEVEFSAVLLAGSRQHLAQLTEADAPVVPGRALGLT